MEHRSHPRKSGLRLAVPLGAVVLAVGAGLLLGERFGQADDADEAEGAHPRGGGELHRDIAGKVVRVSPEEGVLTVDHEEIEGFMGAMVMDLNVFQRKELLGLSAGDEILFDLARIGDTYQAVRIRRRGAEARPPEDAAEAPVADPLGPGDQVPDLELVDWRGEKFRLRELEPRHKLITFFYARCPLKDFCPAQSQRLAKLQAYIAETGVPLHLVSLTLDAEHDGPQVLAGYAARFSVDPARWTLAGGEDTEALRSFAHRAGAGVKAQEGGYQIDHALVALRVDGDRIVDRVYGLDAMEALVKGL